MLRLELRHALMSLRLEFKYSRTLGKREFKFSFVLRLALMFLKVISIKLFVFKIVLQIGIQSAYFSKTYSLPQTLGLTGYMWNYFLLGSFLLGLNF